MEKSKSPVLSILAVGVRLLIICAVSGLILSLINSFTAPVITARQQAEEAAALEELFPGGQPGEKQDVTDTTCREVIASYLVRVDDRAAGYILELQGNGYGGPMKIMASYQADGEVLGVKLMDNEETPGLGKKAEDSRYMQKFIGKGGRSHPIPVTKEMLAAQQSDIDTPVVVQEKPSFLKTLGNVHFGAGQAGGTDSVTGATLTFTGLSQAVAAGSEYVKKITGGQS